MPIIQPPKTIEEWEQVLLNIMELENNSWLLPSMLKTLAEKREKVEAKIEELKNSHS